MPISKTVARILLACLLVFVSSARGEELAATSLEWIVCASDVVAVGKVSSFKTVQPGGDVNYECYMLSVTEIIRGSRRKRIRFYCRNISSPHEVPTWIKSRSSVLVCLKASDGSGDPDDRGLLIPTLDSLPFSIINLDAPEKCVFNGHFQPLVAPDDILKTARFASRALKAKLRAEPKFHLVTKAVPSWPDAKSTVFRSDHPTLINTIDLAAASTTSPTAVDPATGVAPEIPPSTRIVVENILSADYSCLFVPEFMYPDAR